jgi:hypothetical protein
MFNIPQYPSLLAERVNSASPQRVIEEMQEFRSSGVQEFRSSGVQEFRSSGVQEFRSSGVQEFRSSGVQGGVDDEIARMKAPTWSQIGCPAKLPAPAAKREKKAKREKSAR